MTGHRLALGQGPGGGVGFRRTLGTGLLALDALKSPRLVRRGGLVTLL